MRTYIGWRKAALVLAAGAFVAVPAVNMIALGQPPQKEPPPPGVQMDVLAFDPPPSGGGGSSGSN